MSEVRVLLVDDEPEFLRTLAKRLERRGLDVAVASSGAKALQSLAARPTDVVVLDVKMPDMDGLETLEAIRRDHAGTAVVMLTGHADVEAAVQGLSQGAFDYLMKPISIDELIYKIEDAYRAAQNGTRQARPATENRP